MSKAGKINRTDFETYFAGRLGYPRQEIITGPGFGVDVAVIDLQYNQAMMLTSDPLSLIPSLGLQESAWLSVHLMANDMATTGFAPMYGQFVLNLPVSLSEEDFKTYWNYIHRFCSDIKISVTGGHTGSIEGQNSTIAGGGTFVAIGEKNKVLTSSKAQSGNVILVTKQCAISSAAIMAMSFPKTVQAKLGVEIYNNACGLFYQTSSLPEALLAAQLNKDEKAVVTAMHDVTEGGVLGAVYEMATASGNGVLIYDSQLPIQVTEREVCRLFQLDPRCCIGAGAMLMAVKKECQDLLIQAMAEKNIACTPIGELVDAEKGMNIVNAAGEISPLTYQQKDPYWAAFFNALKNNWS